MGYHDSWGTEGPGATQVQEEGSTWEPTGSGVNQDLQETVCGEALLLVDLGIRKNTVQGGQQVLVLPSLAGIKAHEDLLLELQGPPLGLFLSS